MALMIRHLASAPLHLISMADLGPDGVAQVLEHAHDLKSGAPPLPAARLPLGGRAVALLFDKPSLRTRVSFEVGISRLGGTTTSLTGADVGLGSREPVADMARTLSRYVDAIVVRVVSHETLAELADASGVPVVNALTEREHPCQALADMMTLQERLGDLTGRQLVFVGDGNNVCHSLLLGAAAVGMNVRVATPPGYEPDESIVDEAMTLARETGARVEVVRDPASAVEGADAVYTDVWTSMGSEHEAARRRLAFAGFRVTRQLLRRAPAALVMHCLPAHRGEEIDGDVIDGPQSVAFDQAENRMYVQQAALLRLLRPAGRAADRLTAAMPAVAAPPLSAR